MVVIPDILALTTTQSSDRTPRDLQDSMLPGSLPCWILLLHPTPNSGTMTWPGEPLLYSAVILQEISPSS